MPWGPPPFHVTEMGFSKVWMEAMHSWKIFLTIWKEFNLPVGPEPSSSPGPRAFSSATVPASFLSPTSSSYDLNMDLVMDFTCRQTQGSLSLQNRQTRGMAADPTPPSTCVQTCVCVCVKSRVTRKTQNNNKKRCPSTFSFLPKIDGKLL